MKGEEGEISFKWWDIWAWLSILILLAYTFYAWYHNYSNSSSITLLLIINSISIILYIFVLRYNKYAFLLSTILSLNLILWVINGVYLKGRWNHQKVNKNRINIHKFWKFFIFIIILIPILIFKIITIQAMRYDFTKQNNQIANIAQPEKNKAYANHEKYKKITQDINKDLPKMIDEVTRLDKVDINETETTYNYTLINFTFDEEMISQQKELLKETCCNREIIKNLMKKGRIYNYFYDDTNQSMTHIFKISIEDCNTKLVKKSFLNRGIKLYKEKKYKKAIFQFKKAIDNNETRAYVWISYFFKHGLGTKIDTKKAHRLNIIGCNKKNGDCCYEVAEFKYLSSDKDKTNIYYRKACDLGVGKACLMYATNNTPKEDIFGRTYASEKSILYLQKGCKLKNSKSCIILADSYSDPFKGNIYYDKSCKLKLGRACNQLAINYAKGIGKRKDIEVARELFGKACDNKYQSGCTNYANMGKEWQFHTSYLYELPKLIP